MYGRDIVYCLCDVLRSEGMLDMVINNCSLSKKDILKALVVVLEQCFFWENRNYVVKIGFEIVVFMIKREILNYEMFYIIIGILEGLFKIFEEVLIKIINYGGFDVILYWLRLSDIRNFRYCVKVFVNFSLFGGVENQEEMVKRNVLEWFFFFVFMEDDIIRYYVCLVIVVLLANKELEVVVIKLGILELVMLFINLIKLFSFVKCDLF